MICEMFKSSHITLARLWWRPAAAMGLLVAGMTAASGTPAASSNLVGAFSRAGWPLFFEPGLAQSNGPVNFVARGLNYQLLVEPAEVDFMLRKPQLSPAPGSVRRDESIKLGSTQARVLRMAFASGNPHASISGAGKMDGKVNYFLGNDPARWRAQLSTFSSVRVQDLYPGIDLLYYGNHHQLEYDFTVAPHADPTAISLQFEGVDKLAVTSAGELVVGLGDAELRQHRPVIYQIVRGARCEVAGGYQLKDSRTICFAVGPYDHEQPLVIDPVFIYSTYFGGNGGDTGLAIKVDSSGSVYLAGETLSTQFPSAAAGNPFQSQMNGGAVTGDAFVAKLDNTGSKLLYFTYLGGATDDGAYDLAIDSSGNAYVTGFTVSSDFPTKNALFNQISGTPDPTFHVYPVEAFVAELNTNGSALVYSTYLGGTATDVGSGIAVDPAGYVYVTGKTFSTNFPVLNALQASLGGTEDGFVSKFAPGGQSLVYSTYLGGTGLDIGEGIAADGAGSAYVTGYTTSTDFPISTGASQTNLNGSGVAVSVFDAFITKVAPDGSSLVYSTYVGGSQNDYGYRIAVDGSGTAYVTGTTQSPDFPRTNSFDLTLGEDGTNAINFDAFLTKLDPSGQPVYSAQFGGTADDAGWDVAVDPFGRAFVVGITLSTNFPTTNAFDLFQTTNSGGKDVFVIAFDTNAPSVLYSGYLGGSGDDFGYAIAVDAEGNAYLSGMTLSSGFPTTVGPFQGALAGSSDAFVAKIRLLDPMLNVQQMGNGFLLSWRATAPDYVLQSTVDLALPQVWTTYPQPTALTNGEYFVSLTTTNPSALFRLVRH
jgi:hypothetical protein